eukprot:1476863-Rhodomonas_salina.2
MNEGMDPDSDGWKRTGAVLLMLVELGQLTRAICMEQLGWSELSETVMSYSDVVWIFTDLFPACPLNTFLFAGAAGAAEKSLLLHRVIPGRHGTPFLGTPSRRQCQHTVLLTCLGAWQLFGTTAYAVRLLKTSATVSKLHVKAWRWFYFVSSVLLFPSVIQWIM